MDTTTATGSIIYNKADTPKTIEPDVPQPGRILNMPSAAISLGHFNNNGKLFWLRNNTVADIVIDVRGKYNAKDEWCTGFIIPAESIVPEAFIEVKNNGSTTLTGLIVESNDVG